MHYACILHIGVKNVSSATIEQALMQCTDAKNEHDEQIWEPKMCFGWELN